MLLQYVSPSDLSLSSLSVCILVINELKYQCLFMHDLSAAKDLWLDYHMIYVNSGLDRGRFIAHFS